MVFGSMRYTSLEVLQIQHTDRPSDTMVGTVDLRFRAFEVQTVVENNPWNSTTLRAARQIQRFGGQSVLDA